jgi:UDP-N-acetylmuramate--alanine ligase
VLLTDIYAAGEDPIPGATLEALAAAVRKDVKTLDVVPALDDLPQAVARVARKGDVVIMLGAGSISALAERVVEVLS